MNDNNNPKEENSSNVEHVNKEIEVDTEAPSHWTADGHAVVLPAPTRLTRRQWVQRAIVQHGLHQQSQLDKAEDDAEEDDKTPKQKQKQQQQRRIHPLELASARLRNDGIDELNRSINLSELVKQGEYFGLTNIVADAALELAAAKPKEDGTEAEAPAAAAAAPSDASHASSNNNNDDSQTKQQQQQQDEQAPQTFQSLYILKRKHQQFATAAAVLRRQRRRLARGLTADARPLRRLAALRHRWRLTAPEHGQRARPHPVRPTETLAADVDHAGGDNHHHHDAAGRLARRIPRYATIALRQSPLSLRQPREEQQKQEVATENDDKEEKGDAMEIDSKPNRAAAAGNATEPMLVEGGQSHDDNEKANDDDKGDGMCWTYAEPFALADPTLGKLDADFDPSKIEMLTLQFALEDESSPNHTRVSACLEPTRSLSTTAAEPDELVLMELQHSLLCAKLFESMRRELADDTEEVGQIRTTSQQLYQNVVWLAATPAVAATPFQAAGRPHRRALQVVHVHEGEVCVQLSGRYTLRVQLVPSATATTIDEERSHNQETSGGGGGGGTDKAAATTHKELLLLCKTLLWQAHTLYHQHSVRQQQDADDKAAKEEKKAAEQGDTKPVAFPSSATTSSSPHILQGCVYFGTKILMERKMRSCFHELQALYPSLQITCLSTSLLAPSAHWTLQDGDDWHVDVELEGGPHISISWWDHQGDFRKAEFESVGHFRLFLQRQLRRVVVRRQRQQQQPDAVVPVNGHAPQEQPQGVVAG